MNFLKKIPSNIILEENVHSFKKQKLKQYLIDLTLYSLDVFNGMQGNYILYLLIPCQLMTGFCLYNPVSLSLYVLIFKT